MVVEADAFKETDVIYRAISSKGHHNDMLQTAELVSKTILFFPYFSYILLFFLSINKEKRLYLPTHEVYAIDRLGKK